MIFSRLILAIYLVALIGCGDETAPNAPRALPSKTSLPAPTLSASTGPVILIYRENRGGLIALDPVQVILAVWNDGRLAWRKDGKLFESRVEIARVDELLQRMHREGVFGDGEVYYGAVGPDSGFDVIEVHLADRRLRMASWHEGFEANPHTVATSSGIESLNGRDRAAVLASQPPEYQRFRRIWSDIKSTVASWVPDGGKPFIGEIPAGEPLR